MLANIGTLYNLAQNREQAEGLKKIHHRLDEDIERHFSDSSVGKELASRSDDIRKKEKQK